MPQTCTVCRHPEREEIEVAVIRGTPFRDIAGLFDLTKSAVARHAQVHLPAMLAKAEGAREVACADSILGQILGLQESALSILAKAEQSNDSDMALKAIREARGCVELMAKVSGELREGPTVNVLVTPEWSRLQSVILSALDQHPEARLSVAAALKHLEGPVIDADAA